MNRDLPDGRYSQLDVRETVATSGAEIYAADTERKICSASAYCGTQHRRASLETLVWDAYSSASISKAALRALPLSAEGAERNEILVRTRSITLMAIITIELHPRRFFLY